MYIFIKKIKNYFKNNFLFFGDIFTIWVECELKIIFNFKTNFDIFVTKFFNFVKFISYKNIFIRNTISILNGGKFIFFKNINNIKINSILNLFFIRFFKKQCLQFNKILNRIFSKFFHWNYHVVTKTYADILTKECFNFNLFFGFLEFSRIFTFFLNPLFFFFKNFFNWFYFIVKEFFLMTNIIYFFKKYSFLKNFFLKIFKKKLYYRDYHFKFRLLYLVRCIYITFWNVIYLLLFNFFFSIEIKNINTGNSLLKEFSYIFFKFSKFFFFLEKTNRRYVIFKLTSINKNKKINFTKRLRYLYIHKEFEWIFNVYGKNAFFFENHLYINRFFFNFKLYKLILLITTYIFCKFYSSLFYMFIDDVGFIELSSVSLLNETQHSFEKLEKYSTNTVYLYWWCDFKTIKSFDYYWFVNHRP